MTKTTTILTLLLICLSIPHAQPPLSLEAFSGCHLNIPTPLTIKQEGEEVIKVKWARYESACWSGSPYFALRAGLWKNGKAWELELVHEKIILKNKPKDVQHFQVSHGYNLILVNRAWRLHEYYDLTCRVGAGIILAHPETIVRNKKRGYGEYFPKGDYISGPTAQVAVGKRFRFWKGLFGVLEAKFTASYAFYVPIADGYAVVPNLAIHGLFGIGYELGSKR